MVAEYRRGVSRFADLVAPVAPVRFAEALLGWLADSHTAARDLQELRRRHSKADWANTHSFGTDRYHYLVGTAEAMAEELSGVESDQSRQSLFLCTPQALIYQCRAKGGSPDEPLLQEGYVQRSLAMPDVDPADLDPGLFTPKFAVSGGREVIFLLWTGSEEGLAEAWVGQGSRNAQHGIAWTWLHPLRDVIDGIGSAAPSTTIPDGPTQPMLDLPELDLSPRGEEAAGAADPAADGDDPQARPEAG
ncbi:hypothetical protein [Actinoalloteichus fjordicus]|uniref:Uncharacterized protein n=1 Tax=Actinoalloteichus fjordicus TaxID=1612552 RepID=A0AAC9L8Y6_9PSEU|nr:hypothetical protein [Actinoalloteichus fjordicus]APU12525.1 hypothetical protein UA74_02190 [Actinoalloteichus fjordicus]